MAEPAAPPSREFEQKLKLAKSALGSLERAMKTRKLYTADHPLRRDATDEILARFQEFFQRYAYLRVDVSDRELRLEGTPAMVCEPRDPEIPFRLYKDGVRELRFNRGISREEVLAFLSVLELDPRQTAEMDEDLVSLMWSKDLHSIDFVAVDEFEADEPGAGMADPELRAAAREVAAELRRAVDSVSGPGEGGGTGALTAPAAAVKSKAPPPADPDGPPMSDDEIEALLATQITPVVQSLREEVQNETLGGAIRRSLDIILKIFSESGKVTAAEIGPFLRGVTGFYAKKGDVADLAHLLTRLKESRFLETIEGGPELWKLLCADVRVPDASIQLPAYLNDEFDGDFDGLHRYFEIVGPALVPTVCEIFSKIASQRVRVALREYLVDHGKSVPPAVFKALLTSSDKHLGETLEVIRAVKPQGIALDELVPFDKLAGPLKMQALSVAASLEGGARTRILRKALADPDTAFRAHTLRTIAGSKDSFLAPIVKEWIADKGFSTREVDEKALAYRALAKTAGDSALTALQEAATRKPGLFDRQKTNETRRAAVLGIREVGTPTAINALKKMAEEGDDALRDFAQEALKK